MKNRVCNKKCCKVHQSIINCLKSRKSNLYLTFINKYHIYASLHIKSKTAEPGSGPILFVGPISHVKFVAKSSRITLDRGGGLTAHDLK